MIDSGNCCKVTPLSTSDEVSNTESKQKLKQQCDDELEHSAALCITQAMVFSIAAMPLM